MLQVALRPKKCRVCPTRFVPTRPLQVACCPDCAQVLARRNREEAEKRAAAEKARLEAEEKARIAREAYAKAEADDLEAREAAEALIVQAQKADRAAAKAETSTAKAGHGIFGRSASLHSTKVAVLTDRLTAAGHFMDERPDEFDAFLLSLADKEIRAGKTAIPGFEIRIEKKVA